MKKNQMLSITSFITTLCSSFSLIASTSHPHNHLSAHTAATSPMWSEEDLLVDDLQGLTTDSTLIDADEPLTDGETTQEDMALPFEEGDANADEPAQSIAQPNTQPDLNKVLYDPKMNYGTGAPVPKPTPVTTAKRNLIVLGTSTILATIAMLVVASNKGLDAPRSH